MAGEIASPEEVLEVITAIMQGTFQDDAGHRPKVSERCRAAELLAKHYGLFIPSEHEQTGARRQAAALIGEAVARWAEEKGVTAPSTGTPWDG